MEELPTLATMTPHVANKIRAGQQVESVRLREVDQIPASWEAADIHYRAQRFGYLPPNAIARCPCCNEKVDVQPLSFSDGVTNPMIRSDIILYFSFIRTLIVYLVIHLVISDLYNLLTNMGGKACGSGFLGNCPKSFMTLMATTNKLGHHNPLKMLDILNLALVVISVVYFALVRRCEYRKFDIIENTEQTEDDYSVFVTGIPVLMYDEQQGKMTYTEEIKQLFTGIIQNWLMQNRGNPTDPVYLSYLNMARKYGHDPSNPPRIVMHVDLCWNLTELNNYLRHKEELKDKIEEHVRAGYLNMNQNKFQQVQTVQRLGVATLVNTQYEEAMLGVDEGLIDLCTKYDFDRSFNFCLSRFIGKAFVSFAYQEFLQVIINASHSGRPLTLRDEPISVSRADNPGDVSWENLHYPPEELSSRRKNTFWVTAGSLVFAFAFVLLINWMRKRLFSRERATGFTDPSAEWWITMSVMLVVSVFVSLTNWALHALVHGLVGFEAHESSVDEQRAYVIKTLFAQFINTAISFCLVSIIVDKHIWARGGIIMQITVLFFFTAVIQVISNLIFLPSLKRQWVLSNYSRSTPVPRYQDRFNKEYALPDFDMGGRFVYYLLQLFLISFFSYVIPLSVPLVLVVFIIHYFIDRVNLYYRSSNNETYGLDTLRTMYKLMETSVLLFAVGNAFWSGFFGIPMWRPLSIAAVSIAVFYVAYIWLVPFSAQLRVLCYNRPFQTMSYMQCQQTNKFELTYRIMNPATNLYQQGNAQYAFDSATRNIAAMGGSFGQMGGNAFVPPGALGGAPMTTSGYGGMIPVPNMTNSGYRGQAMVPGVSPII